MMRTALRKSTRRPCESVKENIEHVAVRLLDLIEQDYGVRAVPHLLGQFPGLLIADISRRRTCQAGNGEAFHVLGHVDANQCVLIAEQELG